VQLNADLQMEDPLSSLGAANRQIAFRSHPELLMIDLLPYLT